MDAATFKDTTEKRLEGSLKAIFSVAGSALRPSLASAWVNRAIEAWATSLILGTPKVELIHTARCIAETNAFLCKAVLDTAQLIERTSALSVAAPWTLWLKNWSSDISFKKFFTILPFQGLRLFGEKIIRRQGVRGVIFFLWPKQQVDKKIKLSKSNSGHPFAPNHQTNLVQDGYRTSPKARSPMTSPHRHDWAPPPGSQKHIGGQLLRFWEAWLRHSSDSWVKDIVTDGYHMHFASLPHRRFFMSKVPSTPSRAQAFQECVRSLWNLWVIEPVPSQTRFYDYYSNLFIVPKKDNTFRPVLDLKELNLLIRFVQLKMETLCSVIWGMEPGQLLVSLGIKDTYLHVPNWPPHHQYLRFAFGKRHFQFVALPFRLTSAPSVTQDDFPRVGMRHAGTESVPTTREATQAPQPDSAFQTFSPFYNEGWTKALS
ncbi:uncharacterized protein LOC108717852 [Xenopus laevis]|uniref:Uncharacterized protein LOC108717852 n=1 Tax=Xenopus laevis TaxID=8355 RepID=A0A8J1L4C2_XENLA|nr:uncharacterized protein LOC108717852 [Xenopus laevis]